MSKSTTVETASLFWRSIWKYRLYVIGILIAVPISVLAEQYLNVVILANVLNKLSKGHFVSSQIWHTFGPSIIGYAVLMLIGTIGWRVIDGFNWRLEASVERDLARRVYSHLLDQSANFHANRFGGSLVSQTSKLLSSYVRIADTTIYQVLQLLFGIIFTVIILAPRAPLFVVFFLLFAMIYIASGSL